MKKAVTPSVKTKPDMLPKEPPVKSLHPAMTKKQVLIPGIGLNLGLGGP